MQSFRNFTISFLTAFCLTALVFGTAAFIIVPKIETKMFEYSGSEEDGNSDLVVGFEPTSEDVYVSDEESFSILLVGTDKRPKKSESDVDSLIFIKVCPQKNTVVFLPIPTNMEVTVDNETQMLSQIRQIMGMDYLCEKVSGLIGINVNYYAIASLSSFKRIVNDLGGVEYSVPINMEYSDEDEDLEINIPKGNQILDGEDATKMLRYSSDGFDQRMLRNVDFLKGIIRKYTSSDYRSKSAELYEKVGENITTNFEESDFAEHIEAIYGYPNYTEKDIVFPGEYKEAEDGSTFFEPNTSLSYELLSEYR